MTGVRFVQCVVAVALIVLVWRMVDGQEAWRSLSSADPVWLLLALAALSLQTVLSALRWRLTAGRFGIVLGPRRAITEYYLSQVVNQSLPGGVIGDAGRALRSRAQAGLLAAGQAVVLERLAGQIALFAIMAVTFLLTLARPGGWDWPQAMVPPLAIGVAVGLALPLLVHVVGRGQGRLGYAAASFSSAVRHGLFARDVLLPQTVLSLATALCNLAAFAFCAHAVGHPLSPVAVAAIVPLILVMMLVPLTISGWGLREGAAAILFPLAGASAGGGLAASVLFGLMILVSALPGLPFVVLRPKDPMTRA